MRTKYPRSLDVQPRTVVLDLGNAAWAHVALGRQIDDRRVGVSLDDGYDLQHLRLRELRRALFLSSPVVVAAHHWTRNDGLFAGHGVLCAARAAAALFRTALRHANTIFLFFREMMRVGGFFSVSVMGAIMSATPQTVKALSLRHPSW